MKRCGYWLFCIGLVLCGEGCKRSSNGKKDALLVSLEADAVYGPPIPKVVDSLATRSKFEMNHSLVKYVDAAGRATNENNPNGVATYPEGALKPRVEIIWPNKPDKAADMTPEDIKNEKAKMRIIKDTQKRDTIALGKAFWDFRKNPAAEDAGPPDDNAQSLDRLFSYLRRNKQFEAYEKLMGKKMEVTFLYFPNNPTHIIAWHEKGGNEDGDRGAFLMAKPSSFVWMPELVFETSLHGQELSVGWQYAAEFSLSHYTSVPPQTIKQKLNTDAPARVLAWIKQTQPLAMKNPPENRDLAALVKYVKETASPEVAKYFERKHIRVNLNANLYDDNDWLVCQGTAQNKKAADGNDELVGGNPIKLHLTLHCDGRTTGNYDTALIAQKFK